MQNTILQSILDTLYDELSMAYITYLPGFFKA